MEDTRVHLRPPSWLAIVVALILGGSLIISKKIEVQVQEQENNPIPTITVQGEGKLSAVPDIALLTFGVQTGRQKTAEGAMKILAERMNGVIEALEALNIEEKDIKTQSLRLNPAYDYQNGRRVEQGFEAFQNLSVKVRDLNMISQVLDAAVRQGTNQVGGVSFTVDDMDELKAEARELAIENAKEKAEKLADDLGVSLGEFEGFSEGGGYYPQPAMMRMEAVGYGGADVAAPDIPAGEQDIRVTVHLTYRVR